MNTTRYGVVALLTCLALAGCADNTGAIDDMGHNGFDKMTCTDFKALAMDVQYGTVTAAALRDRVQQLSDEAGKAADPAVRRATATYTATLLAGNRKASTTAAAAFAKICMF